MNHYFVKFAVNGVMGMSWGFALPYFDVVRGTSVDYMHCVRKGVMEQLMKSWFEDSGSNVSLKSEQESIDKDLLSIQPISEITRTPRSLSDWKHWKGN